MGLGDDPKGSTTKPPRSSIRAFAVTHAERASRLLVEPDILHAPAVEDAVDHDRQAFDIGALAGAAAAVENDRPHIVVGQLAFDYP